jgi:hypothetical protein
MIGEGQLGCELAFPDRCSARNSFPYVCFGRASEGILYWLLVSSSGAARWRSVLLDFFLGLVRLLLLLLQVGDGGRIRSSCAVRILSGVGGRSRGNTVLTLLLSK